MSVVSDRLFFRSKLVPGLQCKTKGQYNKIVGLGIKICLTFLWETKIFLQINSFYLPKLEIRGSRAVLA